MHDTADPRQLEQVVEQVVHLVGGGDDPAEVLAHRVAASGREVGPGQPGEAADRDERRLEVVGDRVVEALELGVLGSEVGPLGAQRLFVRAQVARHAVERASQIAELVGRVERQRMVQVARGDFPRRLAHLGQRPRQRPRQQQARQQAEPHRGDQDQAAEREQRGAVAAPQLRRPLLLEVTQRGLPGRLRQREDGPARRHPAGSDPEAQLALAAAPDQAQAKGLVARQRSLRLLTVRGVRRRAVGEDEAVPADDQEGDDGQPAARLRRSPGSAARRRAGRAG